ncbi:PREDICTED: centromere protein K, partial [Pterocles gutturalis]|uniref:centromere protein K n=1 Tax=Pterocles gutturalis TaxID=240206 RepID=UPI0005282520
FRCLPEITEDLACPENDKEKLFYECESIWKQMEECQSKLMLLRMETPPKSDAKLHFLVTRMKALAVECKQWQKSPEVISTDPDVLLELGKEELQKVHNYLQMVLSAVQAKNKKLEEDLKREKQWHDEQEQILDVLSRIEEETKTQAEQLYKQREFLYLNNELSKLKEYKEDLLDALCKFLEEHYPLPERSGSDRKME